MDKSIIEHQKYIKSKLAEKLGDSERAGLRRYHEQRVRDFQHERLIHLIVTLFFAVLLIVALVAFLANPESLLQTLFGILVIISLPLEIAYLALLQIREWRPEAISNNRRDEPLIWSRIITSMRGVRV